MTRVSSYTLYQCPSCGQVHIKNEYGSISIYVPTDLYFDPMEIRSCKKCGKENKVQEYINLGLSTKRVALAAPTIDKLNPLGRWIASRLRSKKEVDLSEIYPYL